MDGSKKPKDNLKFQPPFCASVDSHSISFMSIHEPLLKVSYLGNFRYRLVRYYLVNIPSPMLGKTKHPMIYPDIFSNKMLTKSIEISLHPIISIPLYPNKNLKSSGFCILSPSSPHIFPLNPHFQMTKSQWLFQEPKFKVPTIYIYI